MTKNKKIYEIIKDYKDIEVPYKVWKLFGRQAKFIKIAGDQASLAEDFAGCSQIRQALEWYADQFGGKITWKD